MVLEICFLSKKLDIFFLIGYTKIVSIVFVKWYGFNNFVNKKGKSWGIISFVKLSYCIRCVKNIDFMEKIRKLKNDINFEIRNFILFQTKKLSFIIFHLQL